MYIESAEELAAMLPDHTEEVVVVPFTSSMTTATPSYLKLSFVQESGSTAYKLNSSIPMAR